MIDTIEKALSSLSLTAFFLGLGILRYPLNQPRYRLSIFYILTVWSAYVYALYCTTILFALATVFNGILSTIMVMTTWFITIISIIITIYKHETYWQYIKRLDLVDDTLEELGIPKDYHKIQNWTRQALITWFLMICAAVTFDSLLCTETVGDTRAILIPFILSYTTYVNGVMDITFIILLRHIGTRLDKINDYIGQLSEVEKYGLMCKWKESLVINGYYVRNAKNCKHILWIVTHLHSEVCRIARDINGFFGIQTTLQMLVNFIILNSMFYFEYYAIFHLREIFEYGIAIKIWLSSAMWFIIFLTKLILLNHICESVSNKAQDTRGIIYKLTNLIYFSEIREEIYQFLLQISLRPLKFSGLGLFYFGYSFIRKFFIWILSTNILLAQMDFTPLWSTYHNTTYENITISQFSLQMVYVPLKFCGIGLFQFGFKYLHRFVMSIATVSVIVIQARGNK